MSDATTLPLPLLATGDGARLRTIVDANYAFLFRSLRRLGVPAAQVEDAAQQVLLVTARRLDAIADGAERAFLFGVALRTASDVRRANVRRREVQDEPFLAAHRDPAPGADVVLDDERARRTLDAVLDRLPMDLRAVFVLADLEEMTMAKIAELLELPPGTVASRLRRARERFAEEASAMRAALIRGDAR